MLAQSDEWDALKQQRALEAEKERHEAMGRTARGSQRVSLAEPSYSLVGAAVAEAGAMS